MQLSRNTVFRVFVGFSVLVILSTCLLVILFLLAPTLIEQRSFAFLAGEGVEVETFEVEQAGLTGTRLGSGMLRKDGHSLGWESIGVRYVPSRLARGKLDHLVVSGPALHINLPAMPVISAPPEKQITPDYSLEEAAPGREEVLGQDTLPPVEAPVAGKESTGLPVVVEKPRQDETMDLAIRRVVEGLPFADGFMGNGRLAVDWAGIRLLDAGWDGHFVNDPDQFNGELRIEGELLNAVLTLQTNNASSGVSLFGELEISPAPLMEFIDKLPGDSGFEFPALHGLGLNSSMKGEFLVESSDGAALQMSGLVSSESIDWQMSSFPLPFRFNNVLLLGTYHHGEARLEGGGRFADFNFEDLSVKSFGLLFSRDPEGLLNLETETIEINWKGWSGKAAVRGRAHLDSLNEGGHPRMELAFNELTGPLVRIEPASLLVEVDSSTLRLGASALGLERDSTLWVEELEGLVALSDGTMTSGFTWYNGAGAHMGDIAMDGKLANQENYSGAVRLSDPDGKVFLNSHIMRTGEDLEFNSTGELSLKWLNSLGKWWWGRFVTLSGKRPLLDVRLARSGFLLKGNLRLVIDSLDLAIPDGPFLEGISGDLRFKVLGLPQSEGKQTLRIDSLTTGNARISDVTLELSLPTLRNLVVNQIKGKIGSGYVYLDPFTVDPVQPDFGTTLRFERLPAQQLLDWLKEKRFALQGVVTGKIPLQWKGGVLYVGQAELRMDTSTTINRFIFSDKTFLEEQFASMTGVPANLKKPFLATLLADGIRIRDLTLALVPNRDKGEVALKLQLSGETRSESMEVPIESLIINNVISDEDLGQFLGFFGPVKFLSAP